MAVQLTITFDELVNLVKQLPPEQRQTLVARVQDEAPPQELTKEERWKLFEAAIIKVQVTEDFSFRREDWYGDDGR